MSVPIKLRDDFSAGDIRGVARRCRDGAQVRRLLALATILDGGSRSEAAKVGGVTPPGRAGLFPVSTNGTDLRL